MSSENWGSFARAILTTLGTFLIGKTLFGHALLSDTFDTISGVILTAGSIAWSFYKSTATEETTESLVRQLLQGGLGLLVGSGLLGASQAASVTAMVMLAIPFAWSYLSKKKTASIATGQLTPQTNGQVVKATPKINSPAK